MQAYGCKYLGGEIGFTMVLHTWSQTLTEHIHVHCIVTGGALQQTKAGPRWRASAQGFLFPIVSYRIAISNHRIVSISRGRVRFTYHDNRDGGREAQNKPLLQALHAVGGL